MVKRFIVGTWAVSLLLVFFPQGSLSADDLSDSQKKEVVDQLYDSYKKDFPEIRDIRPIEVIRLLKKIRRFLLM